MDRRRHDANESFLQRRGFHTQNAQAWAAVEHLTKAIDSAGEEQSLEGGELAA
jgi:hypothetical protein